MSLQSTLESIDDSISPSSSQQQQLFVTTTAVRNQHLSLAQMRGVIQIFYHYFPKNVKKRMSRDEKARKWISYKNKIYQQYKRIITGKFASEKALVKRYSEPLAFLKYKLKRAKNLNIEDLSKADQDYYFEIGGLQDVNELIRKTYNIDSVEKLTDTFETYNFNRNRNKKRTRQQMESGISASIDPNDNNNNNDNRNVLRANDDVDDNDNINNNGQKQKENYNDDLQVLNGLPANIPAIQATDHEFPPAVNVQPKMEEDTKLTEALSFLNDKMNIFEREQLDKKKTEIFEITKQKLLAIRVTLESQMLSKPHLIGFIPSVEDQNSLAFDCWLNLHKTKIKKDSAVKEDVSAFIEQLNLMKSDPVDWKNFVSKWKIWRIMFDDKFEIVWNKVKQEFNLEPIMRSNCKNKEENEFDDQDDEMEQKANQTNHFI